MPVGEVKKYNLEQLRDDAHELKEVFVDTIQFAIDKDLVKSLYTLVMLRNFHKKVGKFRIGVSEIIKTENVEIIYIKKSELLDLIVMLSKSLEDILLGLSYLEIRKQYNLNPLLVATYKDMTDSEKIEHMLILIQHGLEFQDVFDDSDDLDLQDD